MSVFILLSKEKKMLFHTLDENCMDVECEIGLEATGEPKKEIAVVAN
jgi:hypothetical protein